jgi:hypothetical protein
VDGPTVTFARNVIAAYDRYVLAAGREGLKFSHSRAMVAADVAANPAVFGKLTRDEQARMLVNFVLKEQRDWRAVNREPLLRTAHDAATGMTFLGRKDPILDTALRVGTADGLDKALRYFDVTNFRSMLDISEFNRIKVDDADDRLKGLVQPIIDAMRTRGAVLFEDLL